MVIHLATAYDKWALPVGEYEDPMTLVAEINDYGIGRAEEKLKVLRPPNHN